MVCAHNRKVPQTHTRRQNMSMKNFSQYEGISQKILRNRGRGWSGKNYGGEIKVLPCGVHKPKRGKPEKILRFLGKFLYF